MSDVEKLNKLLIADNCVYSLSLINEKDIGYDLNLGLGSIENSKAVSIDFHDIHGLALNVDAIAAFLLSLLLDTISADPAVSALTYSISLFDLINFEH